MDFKKTFISLTQWTIPHGYEETIAHLLPKGLQKDGIGNYFITIGESKTLFTCHLDTVSKRDKIHHIIEGNIIKTNGKTILGGDNKAGVCILMYLIEQKVPGTYYFFVGEECGTIGSRWALQHGEEFFKGFKRAIAFDRRNQGSIITYQRGRRCCSDEFAKALGGEFGKSRMEYHIDPTGVYTDTAVFVNVIPECTNLSAGVVGEHTNSEYVDIDYCERVAKACVNIDWESLPAVREAKEEVYQYNGGNNYYTNRKSGYSDIYTHRKNKGLLGSGKFKKVRDPDEEEEEEDDSVLANDDHYQATGKRGNVKGHFSLVDDEEEECEFCNGDGSHACNTCGGLGEIECDKCDGIGKIYSENVCKTCKGDGLIEIAENQDVCPDCDGEGVGAIKCNKCKGEGNLGECEMCESIGDIECGFCGGSGISMGEEDEDEDDEYVTAGYDMDDDDSSDFSSRGGFFKEDPNDYDWKRWNNDRSDSDYKKGIEKFDSFLNNKRNDEVYSENLMVIRQPNELFGIWNEKNSSFLKFNLLDEEVQEILIDEMNISNIIANHMINAAVTDKLSNENSEQFHKSDDGLGRWRFTLNELESKVGGENMVDEAKNEVDKFIFKQGEKVAIGNKKTRRGSKKQPIQSDSIISEFMAFQDTQKFINSLNDSKLEEFIDVMKNMTNGQRKNVLNRILKTIKQSDLNKGKPAFYIFKTFRSEVDDLI